MDGKLIKLFLNKRVKVIKSDGFSIDGVIKDVSKDSLLLVDGEHRRIIVFSQILELRELSGGKQ
jgi:hypothetical protein